jgi:hypothetical protein
MREAAAPSCQGHNQYADRELGGCLRGRVCCQEMGHAVKRTPDAYLVDDAVNSALNQQESLPEMRSFSSDQKRSGWTVPVLALSRADKSTRRFAIATAAQPPTEASTAAMYESKW